MAELKGRADITPLKVLDGINARLMLYPDTLVIRRVGLVPTLVASIFRAERQDDETIHLDQITDVQIIENRFLTNGYLEFTVGKEDETKVWLAYSAKHTRVVQEIREIVRDVISKNQAIPPFKSS